VPALETKTALNENVTGIGLSGRTWIYDDDRTEKICLLDVGRADRGWAAIMLNGDRISVGPAECSLGRSSREVLTNTVRDLLIHGLGQTEGGDQAVHGFEVGYQEASKNPRRDLGEA
jgi:hypothetical protein